MFTSWIRPFCILTRNVHTSLDLIIMLILRFNLLFATAKRALTFFVLSKMNTYLINLFKLPVAFVVRNKKKL